MAMGRGCGLGGGGRGNSFDEIMRAVAWAPRLLVHCRAA
jgi:hypothetical protein